MRHERVEELNKKRAQLAAQIQRCDAQRNVLARKLELKRKLVAGEIFLRDGYSTDESLRAWFHARLKRLGDRKLFGLDELAETSRDGGLDPSSPRQGLNNTSQGDVARRRGGSSSDG